AEAVDAAPQDAELVGEFLPGPAVLLAPDAELAALQDRATDAALGASHRRVIPHHRPRTSRRQLDPRAAVRFASRATCCTPRNRQRAASSREAAQEDRARPQGARDHPHGARRRLPPRGLAKYNRGHERELVRRWLDLGPEQGS